MLVYCLTVIIKPTPERLYFSGCNIFIKPRGPELDAASLALTFLASHIPSRHPVAQNQTVPGLFALFEINTVHYSTCLCSFCLLQQLTSVLFSSLILLFFFLWFIFAVTAFFIPSSSTFALPRNGHVHKSGLQL